MPIRLIALTRRGIGVACHSDSTWTIQEFPSDLKFTCIAGAPSHPDRLIAGTQGNGVWASDNTGRTWQPYGLPGFVIKSIAYTSDCLLVGTKNPPLIFTRQNGNSTWQELIGFRTIPSRPFWFSPAEKPYTAYVQSLDHAPGNPACIIAGMEAGAVVASQDGGKTWRDHHAGAMRDCHALGFHPRHDSYAYAVGGNGQGAALSRDGGQSWLDCRAGLTHRYAWAFAADPNDPECWYVAAAPGPRQAHGDDGNAQAHIYRRRGQSGWEQLQTGLSQSLPSMPYALIAPTAQPNHLYAGLRNGQIHASSDNGDHWEQLPVQFDGIRRTLLVQS